MVSASARFGSTAAFLVATLLSFAFARDVAAQGDGAPSGFQAGSRTIFELNLAATPLGEFPSDLKALLGTMRLVQKDGKPMLRASNPSEFLVRLPEVLPQDFTLEFALVPKGCCGPDDLMLEGTPTMNRGTASAQLTWHPERLSAVGGAPDMYQAPMPEDLKATLPGKLTQVALSFAGSTIKLYTNGRRVYTLDRKFARGRVLRVFLGGQDDAAQAVYLAGLRISTNMPPALYAKAEGNFVPGSRTLFDLNTPPPPPPPPGQPAKPRPGIKFLQGAWAPVQKDGMRMFKMSKPTELLVSLLEPLPQSFTLEIELVPKACCAPADLALGEVNQGEVSAYLTWDSDDQVGANGGGEYFAAPMPDEFKAILPSALTEVTMSFDGTTIKLYTNGRRLYTLTDRRFARGKTLRISLGAQDDQDQAQYLAKLRIATNSPRP